MIRPPDTAERLPPLERFGLAVLLHASRLLPVDDPGADVVRLSLEREPSTDAAPAVLGSPRAEARVGDGEVFLDRAALLAAGQLAGGVAEQGSEARDRHERVPPGANPLVAAGQFREPLVSQVGARLRKAVERAAGRRPLRTVAPWPDGRRWAVVLTHDLDLVAGWPSYTLLRAAELAGRLRPVQAARVLLSGLAALGRDPVWQAIRELLEVERELGVRSTWFVICGTPTFATMRVGDVTYTPESPAVRRILGAVAEAGHEIALHGSFETLLDAGRFTAQRQRLTAITGREAAGVRQHFLRMRPGITHRAMATAGFSYDATWGFPDRNGFRLGVADVVPGWDAERQAPSGLSEVPLVWMDRALSKYAGVEQPDRWVDDALALARACRDVNGAWVGLWHPNLTPALGFPGAPRAFRRLVEVLLGGLPWADRADRLVAWREARRGLRAVRVAPDGRVELAGRRRWDAPAVLEEPRGGPPLTLSWPEPASA